MLSNIIYRLTSFADYTNFRFDAENVELLSREFTQDDYAFNPLRELMPNGNVYQGIFLVKSDGSINIKISSCRIDIEMGSDKKEGFSSDEADMIKEATVGTFSKIYRLFEKKIQEANRLAWVAEYAYFDIDEEKKHEFRKRILNPIGFYKIGSTTEFDAKYAGIAEFIVNGKTEKINVISTIQRWFPGRGMGYVAEVDGYAIVIDINTTQDDKKSRFSPDSYKEFISKADEIQSDIIGDIVYE